MSGKRTAFIIIFTIFCLPLLFYARCISQRPPRTNLQQQLFPGISYTRKVYSEPRPYIAHIAAIDLDNSKAKPFVTPTNPKSVQQENSAMTTSDFVEQSGVQLAVNGSFFYPFEENTPWDYYPHTNDPAIALGESITDGDRYGKIEPQWNVLCFDRANRVEIALQQQCPNTAINGVAGRRLVVKDGRSAIDYETKAYARTVVAVNRQKNKLWLIVVDGKQPFYSEGATLQEVAQLAISLGGDMPNSITSLRALNLDGGGSSTLAIEQNDSVRVLNAPIHTKIPMRERPVANHLGFSLP